jgi:hypothetical protein
MESGNLERWCEELRQELAEGRGSGRSKKWRIKVPGVRRAKLGEGGRDDVR